MDKYSKDPQSVKVPQKQKLHILKLHTNIGGSDLTRMVEQAKSFLEKRNQVRIMVQLRGREKSRPQSGVEFLNNVLEQLAEYGTAQRAPSPDNLTVVVNPAKKKS